MNPPFQIKTNVRIPELDGLRGLAILLVLFDHFLYNGLQPETGKIYAFVHAVFPLSWSGVDLFFVLSGFLIGGILMDQRHTEHYFKTFYIRRVCRIFPIYFLWVVLFVICSGLFSSRFHQLWVESLFNRQGIPDWSYFVFLQNLHTAKTGLFGSAWLAVTWSLAVEEQFYLFMPLLVWLVPVRKLPHVLVTLIILVPVFRLGLYLFYPQFFVYVLLPGRADSLLIGALCACWIRQDLRRGLCSADGFHHVSATLPGSIMNPGNALYVEYKLDEASAKYREALRLNPDSVNVKNRLRAMGVPAH